MFVSQLLHKLVFHRRSRKTENRRTERQNKYRKESVFVERVKRSDNEYTRQMKEVKEKLKQVEEVQIIKQRETNRQECRRKIIE